jgi:ABC-type amino acid transport substrate-binding protein
VQQLHSAQSYHATTERTRQTRGEIDTNFGDAFMDAKYFGEGCGIAVKKGNSQLRQVLDYALAALAARGTYTNLYLKYFPLGFY